MKLENKGEGGFIFVSHSHRDIDFVRKLRNELEKAGFEPLCLYLKCMDKCMEDEALKEELKSLLLREISAREWFLYVNSEYSQESEWAQFERQCVEKVGKRKILQVNVDAEKTVNRVAEVVLKNLRVFMSYSHTDRVVARRIKNLLVDNDYRVFFAEDALLGMHWKNSIRMKIAESVQEGFVMVLLSEASVKAADVMREIEEAFEMNGTMAVVCLGDVSLPEEWKVLFADQQVFRLSANPSEHEIQNMIDEVGNALVAKMQFRM